MESMHQAGYIYNDLKPDNILLDYNLDLDKLSRSGKNLNINVIDFGFSTRNINKTTNKHIEKSRLDTFRGNMIFASINQLNFCTTSRRDDLISLVYLLMYFLRGGSMPGFDCFEKLGEAKKFL